MTNPEPMSSATFKTLRESIGVSAPFLAERIGIHEQNVWRYELPTRTLPVPERAAEVLRQMRSDFELVAGHIASDADDAGTVARQVEAEDFDEAHPQMAGWGTTARSLVVARALDIIRDSGALGRDEPSVAWG